MTRYPMQPYQVQAALEGRLSRVTVPFKVQPHAGLRSSPFVKSGIEDGHGREIKWPFPETGNTFVGLEPCRPEELDHEAAVAYMLATVDTIGHEFPPEGLDGIRYKIDGGFLPIENSPAASELWSLFRHTKSAQKNLWVSSAIVPTWASRITLTVLRCGVQRLGDVTEAEAVAMGFKANDISGAREWWIVEQELDNLGYFYPDHWQFYVEVSVSVK